MRNITWRLAKPCRCLVRALAGGPQLCILSVRHDKYRHSYARTLAHLVGVHAECPRDSTGHPVNVHIPCRRQHQCLRPQLLRHVPIHTSLPGNPDCWVVCDYGRFLPVFTDIRRRQAHKGRLLLGSSGGYTKPHGARTNHGNFFHNLLP